MISQFYDDTVAHEAGRLDENLYRRLERDMTVRTLAKHARPGRLLDVGGGPGAYLAPLLQAGFDPWLCDLSPVNVQHAEAAARQLGLHHRTRVANAVELPYESEGFDAVLAAGPFYHLLEAAEQRRARDEILRVLRPGGVVACGILPRLHPLRYLLREASPESLGRLEEIDWERLLAEGRYTNPGGDPLFFTDAFLWRVAEFCDFLAVGGCTIVDVVAVEGFCAFMDVPLCQWGIGYERLLGLVERTAREPDAVGAAEHVLVVARK